MKRILILPFVFLSLILAAQTNPDTAYRKLLCPVCKDHKNVISIVYGKPTKSTIEKAERGECRLGGCIVGPNSPKYYCKKDEKEF